MKAAVLHQLGQAPKYEDFEAPVTDNENHILMTVKAAALKNLDKGRASGQHYASYKHLPVVVGTDGVGVLEDGTRVYAAGITGTMAEKALIDKNKYTVLPDGIDDITAAALPNAVLGADLALRYRAYMEKGKTILINGATGITGKVAIQLARYYGANKIIATGRNAAILETLPDLGADVTISLKQSDEAVIKQIKDIHATTPIDIVLDYLWGHPVELIIAALKGSGLPEDARLVRIVTVGDMAGATIPITSGIFRSAAIEIAGSGFGSLPKEAFDQFNTEAIPTMMQLAINNQIHIDTEAVQLADVETVWNERHKGKRIVLVM